MKKVLVCLLLLLAVSASAAALAPKVSAQTENVKILSYNYYLDTAGIVTVVGEVQNTGPNILQTVVVQGTITTTDGASGSSGAQAYCTNLLPGQKAPFYIEFLPDYLGLQSWYGEQVANVSLSIFQAPTTTQYQYRDVVVTNPQATPKADGTYYVNGELKNIGDQTATKIVVFATFYNSQGKVVAVGDNIDAVASLVPQESVPVSVPAFDVNQTIVNSENKITGYSLLVELQTPLINATTEAPAPTVNPTISPGGTPVPNASSNPTSNPSSSATDQANAGGNQTTIYAVGVAAAVIAVLAAILLVRRRKPRDNAPVTAASSKRKGQNKKHQRQP